MIQQKSKNLFGLTIGQLEGYRVGEHKGVAAKLSKMTRAVNRNSAVLGPPSQVDRLIIPQVRIFQLPTIDRTRVDHFLAYTWNRRSDGTFVRGKDFVWILKPWLLRGTYWESLDTQGNPIERNGVTYVYSSANERVASKEGEDDENQRIIPSYQPKDIIFAIRGVYGGMDKITADDASQNAHWMDLNVDGRMWAKV